VVFSITLVALQMATTQFTPRVLRTFVRRPVTKVALSSFIATFVYSLVVLAGLGTTRTVPEAAVGLAFVLVLVSAFVYATVRSMRVTYVIETIHHETLRSIDAVFPPRAHYIDTAEPDFEAAAALVTVERKGAVLDGMESAHLVRLARDHECVLRLLVEVGTYLPTGTVFLEVHGGSVPSTREIRGCLDLAAVRTHDILGHVATRPDPPGNCVGAEGRVRLVRAEARPFRRPVYTASHPVRTWKPGVPPCGRFTNPHHSAGRDHG
jgi:uncharacterized membrane protein